jgi:hypothetical protein
MLIWTRRLCSSIQRRSSAYSQYPPCLAGTQLLFHHALRPLVESRNLSSAAPPHYELLQTLPLPLLMLCGVQPAPERGRSYFPFPIRHRSAQHGGGVPGRAGVGPSRRGSWTVLATSSHAFSVLVPSVEWQHVTWRALCISPYLQVATLRRSRRLILGPAT